MPHTFQATAGHLLRRGPDEESAAVAKLLLATARNQRRPTPRADALRRKLDAIARRSGPRRPAG
jgi:hypothetical protein